MVIQYRYIRMKCKTDFRYIHYESVLYIMKYHYIDHIARIDKRVGHHDEQFNDAQFFTSSI